MVLVIVSYPDQRGEEEGLGSRLAVRVADQDSRNSNTLASVCKTNIGAVAGC